MSVPAPASLFGERIRVRGRVQGVGFRPTVWRIAHSLGLRGQVANDSEGVLIEVWGAAATLHEFVARLRSEAPPLAHVGHIERTEVEARGMPPDFRIVARDWPGASHATGGAEVTPDTATCATCVAEIFDPFARRFRYPFTNCTHCGPRFSIIRKIPYDRANTTMASFALCAACATEYHDPADRRFHAQPIGCHACGPKLALTRADGRSLVLEALTTLDEADAAASLLQRGQVLAVQGLGGYQLACDATQLEPVARLRAGKCRDAKPFALMARDLEMIRRYSVVSEREAALLASPAAPIVVLDRCPANAVLTDVLPAIAAAVAPGLRTLGFMLPNTPLHHLMLRRMNRPIVLTSGNLSDEPQAIEREDARRRLAVLVDYFVEHDRPIARRVDDSVVRVVGGHARTLRRARGYAPSALTLPAGFATAGPVLAYGGELKNTFCLLRNGATVLSPHMGDLHNAPTHVDYSAALANFHEFFDFKPSALACDLHPDYASTLIARTTARATGLPLIACQHHHAHIAACLADNGIARQAAPVLGVALDGIGYGGDGTLWGGEFLLADYVSYQRLATFKPVALLGGDATAREPWRNTYAHLMAQMGWAQFAMNFADLELYRFLATKPRDLLDGMLERSVNAPLASSCGRLFDAVAAALGIVRERALYEGQGAIELEACVDADCLRNEDSALSYPFNIPRLASGLPYIEPVAMWAALLGDLVLNTPRGVIAARFHRGLAQVIVRMVDKLATHHGTEEAPLRTVALCGGVFQNRILLERVLGDLEARGFVVLTHRDIPSNDGGLSLGQATIAAAQLLRTPREERVACV